MRAAVFSSTRTSRIYKKYLIEFVGSHRLISRPSPYVNETFILLEIEEFTTSFWVIFWLGPLLDFERGKWDFLIEN